MIDYDKTLGSRIFDKVNIILLILVVVATLYPFYYITVVSLSNGNAVLRGEVQLFPVGFTLDSYKLVFENPAVPLSLRNSLVYTTLGTAINLAMTTLCAYPLARPRFSGRRVFTWIITLTMFFSGGLIPLYLLVMQLGLINNMWALLLPGAINVWNMFILRTSFQQIPEELYEAALIDGANDLQTLIRVALPLSKAVLATLLMFYAVAHWNDFFNALIFLNDRAKYPIQLVMRNIVILGRFEQTNELAGASDFAVIEQTLKYATIMVSTIPILLVYPFVQKYFVRGVMIGAIKG
jgi:putative aldouronate transport system permease protein